MTLKVLHVLDHSVPLHSGYAFRTLAILREQHRLGWQTVHVTTPKQGDSPSVVEDVEGLTFVRTRCSSSSSLTAQMRATARNLRQVIDDFSPDLIHAHSPVLTGLPSLYAARHARLPVVYEVRALWEDAAVDHGTTAANSVRYRLSRLAETFVLRRADHVTTICDGLRQEIVGRGITPDKITVIPNAVDIERFEYITEPNWRLREELGIGSSPTVGFIGSLYGYEGLELLLDALLVLASDPIDVHAVVVGGGPEEEKLRRKSQQLGLRERVHFVGRVSQSDVHRYYGAIDLMAYPRKRTRLTDLVTPLKPLEAMAQGKLVLASDVGGHKELIRGSETGVLFAADDAKALSTAIRTLIRGPQDQQRMREQARAFVREERNWALSVSGYKTAYDSALRRKGRALP